ncbi:MAG: hypothetical protein HZA18_06035 [Nitrospirae bacterium]|nr:hypothetical protein [Nitrospirota bacterium]
MISVRSKILAVLPFCLILATVFIVSRIDLERFVLNAGERKLLHFSPEKAEMEPGRVDPVTAGVSLMHVNFFYSEKTGKDTSGRVTGVNQKTGVSQKQNEEMDPAAAGPVQRGEVIPKQESDDDVNKNRMLTFVVLNGKHSIAIVDDRIVHEGETVGGMTVKKIEKDKVLVQDKTLRWLSMEEEK